MFSRLRRLLLLALGPESVSVLEPTYKCLDPGLDMEMEPVGRAVFPNCNLVREGCLQNVTRIFMGSRVALATTRRVAKGEELVINPQHNLNMRRCRRKIELKYPIARLVYDR